MAIPAYRVTVTVRDSEAHESTLTTYLPGGVLHADVLLAAGRLADVVEGVTQGEIARVEVTQQTQQSAQVPAGNIDNEIKGQFSFYNEDGKVTILSVPAFNRSYLLPNSDEIDTSAGPVSAFIDEMTGGGWVDGRNADLETLRSALEAYTRRRG